MDYGESTTTTPNARRYKTRMSEADLSAERMIAKHFEERKVLSVSITRRLQLVGGVEADIQSETA